ncbi:MAG: bifunctional phosphoribosyl-AMP cyclohydrolase/phosphoribosyl-ATP diphosphatase HisIE [Promethearchaeota archaeon]|jgi:phosphoribosyl-ATP pyrophosphohydrolase/phosphoribosyl-AMP cyclohydrolase
MLILKVEMNDIENVGGIAQFIKEIFIKRNWDVFLTLVLKIKKQDFDLLDINNNLEEISQNLDLRFEIDDSQDELKKLLYKKGYKTVTFALPNRNVIIDFDSKMNYSLIDDSLLDILDFDKGLGLIPTIVQDLNNTVLMLAYSSKESLNQTINTRKATYFSRSRNKLWIKGEESGNYQEVNKILFDCDKDSLLFKVEQTGYACHTGSYSCFSDKEFSLSFLYNIIIDRIRNSTASDSYTKRLAEDNKLLLSKIKEESLEVINFTDRDNLIWEIADLTYFILVLMAKNGIKFQEILNELKSRRNYGK